MKTPVFKDVETGNTIHFNKNNTNKLSLMNLALKGEYQKRKLNPDDVYNICCYIANGFLLAHILHIKPKKMLSCLDMNCYNTMNNDCL